MSKRNRDDKLPRFPTALRPVGVYKCILHNAILWMERNINTADKDDVEAVVDVLNRCREKIGDVPTAMRSRWNDLELFHLRGKIERVK